MAFFRSPIHTLRVSKVVTSALPIITGRFIFRPNPVQQPSNADMPRPPASGNTGKRGRPSKTASLGASSSAKPRPPSGRQSRPADPFLSSDDEASGSRSHAADSDDAVEVLDSDDEGEQQQHQSKRRRAGTSRAGDDDADDTAVSGRAVGRGVEVDGDEEAPEKVVPPALVARLLQEMFQQEGTRMTADASRAAAKYVDIFVREAIARCIHERDGAFLEVRLPLVRGWTKRLIY